VAEQRPCCEHYLLCLLWDISRALVHLHDRPGRPMVHLDIKPEVRTCPRFPSWPLDVLLLAFQSHLSITS
jgi:hypothetical protein